ncbi:MAG: glycosyltransferase [Candidatus Eremiobacteraeota bacterium]|nr:glycosyltransferase [Candidatus Eremiobacteraeota bacterium]
MNGVLIAIPTFRRPHLLGALLDGLAKQSLPDGLALSALVLDNDAAGSARNVVRDRACAFPFPLSYRCVKVPGLSAVRNAALEAASGSEFLAMIDDDEVPEPRWLAELVRVQRATGADAVVGPVPPRLSLGMPRWLHGLGGAHFERARDGQRISEGWSGNCLVRMQTLKRLALRFDPALNFSGGEDQMFFRSLSSCGGVIVYARDAIAWEDVPPERRSLQFVLSRSFRRGTTLSICDRRLKGTAGALVLRAAKGAAHLVIGVAKAVTLGMLQGPDGIVGGSLQAVRGAGMLAGLAGAHPQAYRRE